MDALPAYAAFRGDAMANALDLCIKALLNDKLTREGLGTLHGAGNVYIPYLLTAPTNDTRQLQFGTPNSFMAGSSEAGYFSVYLPPPYKAASADMFQIARFRISRTLYGFKDGPNLYDIMGFVWAAYAEFAGQKGNAEAITIYRSIWPPEIWAGK